MAYYGGYSIPHEYEVRNVILDDIDEGKYRVSLISEITGLSRMTINRWFKGQYHMRLVDVERLFSILSVMEDENCYKYPLKNNIDFENCNCGVTFYDEDEYFE